MRVSEVLGFAQKRRLATSFVLPLFLLRLWSFVIYKHLVNLVNGIAQLPL